MARAAIVKNGFVDNVIEIDEDDLFELEDGELVLDPDSKAGPGFVFNETTRDFEPPAVADEEEMTRQSILGSYSSLLSLESLVHALNLPPDHPDAFVPNQGLPIEEALRRASQSTDLRALLPGKGKGKA